MGAPVDACEAFAASVVVGAGSGTVLKAVILKPTLATLGGDGAYLTPPLPQGLSPSIVNAGHCWGARSDEMRVRSVQSFLSALASGDNRGLDRKAEIERRTRLLIERFDEYVVAFDRHPAFTRSGQLEYHALAIKMRHGFGSVGAALDSDQFLEQVRLTVRAWGIGGRSSVLVDDVAFGTALRKHRDEIIALEERRIDDAGGDTGVLGARLWCLISSLEVVENDAKLVSSTKVLHHLLPDLFVPMDRQFTRSFFCWHVPEFQYKQESIFLHAFERFVWIARATDPKQYVTGKKWRTSRTKIIDNALVGFCINENVPQPS
jgi:hypothetical protein